MTADEHFYHKVRLLQRRTKCSNTVCKEFVRLFKKENGTSNKGLVGFDNKSKAAAGTEYIKLHGCPKCDRYIYRPGDPNSNCPFIQNGTVCGHPRYNEKKKPWELAFYFPLGPRLQALLRIPGFKQMLEHEFTRPRAHDPNIMYDIYDSPAWKQYMGPPSQPCRRIGLQGCTDGFQAFNCGGYSVTPIEFAILSLPPAERFKPEFMLLLMFMPTNVKGFSQKKYFEFASNEINALFYKGVAGIKVKVFSFSEDTIGRHALLGLQATTGYDSGCCVCLHKWTPGSTGSKCCFGGYRALLPMRSRGRQARVQAGGNTYEYQDAETRPIPKLRTTRLARECVAVVEAVGIEAFRGHKRPPLFASWAGMECWFRLQPPELMHDTKIMTEMLLKTLVGKVSDAGFYANWAYDESHRRENKLKGIFRDTWPENGGPLPWRLTRAQRLLLDTRAAKLIWPQTVEKLYYNGASFWCKPNRLWKARRKFALLYFILPCQLRDQVPAVRHALNVFVWAMRRLLVSRVC